MLDEEDGARMFVQLVQYGNLDRNGLMQIDDINGEELVELSLRRTAKESFDGLLGNRLPEEVLARFKEIFFRILYPPAFGHRIV
jgi:hypothetical protein